MNFDIENAGMGDESHSVQFGILFDNKEEAEKQVNDINFALRLVKEMKEQIKADNDFMYEKDPKTLMGTYSTMVRRGILETMWSRADNKGHTTLSDVK